jgi:UPF0716 protein FxsA
MPALLVLALVIVPLAELAIIIQVNDLVGLPLTIGLLLGFSILGAVLLKRESRRAFADFRAALAEARWPGDEVAQGALVIFGGALLLTPGFLTDVVGLLCLLPPTRAAASRLLRARLTIGVVGGGAARDGQRADGRGSGPSTGGAKGNDHGALEVEVVEVRREELPPSPDDGHSDR